MRKTKASSISVLILSKGKMLTLSLAQHYTLFPLSLGQILREYGVTELHLSLNAGNWNYDRWGYPEENGVATGAELWAWMGDGSSRSYVPPPVPSGDCFPQSLHTVLMIAGKVSETPSQVFSALPLVLWMNYEQLHPHSLSSQKDHFRSGMLHIKSDTRHCHRKMFVLRISLLS